MKVRGGRGREALYIGCVYMPTDSNSVSVMNSVYEQLKEDVHQDLTSLTLALPPSAYAHYTTQQSSKYLF